MSAQLTWYGQASYLISNNGVTILIDPFFTDSIAESGFVRLYDSPVKKGELKVNYVISTHNHGDHMDVETLKDMIDFDKFYGPSSCKDPLIAAGFPDDKINALNRGDKIELGGMTINAVHAEHTPDSIGVIIDCDGVKLYFTGDSLFKRELSQAREHSPDILLTCINGKFGNMTWQEAFIFAHSLKVKLAIPNHYDLFAINTEDPNLFVNAFKRSKINGMILDTCKPYDIASLLKS